MISRPALLTTALALAACSPAKRRHRQRHRRRHRHRWIWHDGHVPDDRRGAGRGRARRPVRLRARRRDRARADHQRLRRPGRARRVAVGDLSVTAGHPAGDHRHRARRDRRLAGHGPPLRPEPHRRGRPRRRVAAARLGRRHPPGLDDPNPQGVTFAADGLAYVPLFAAPAVQIYDFSAGRLVGLAAGRDRPLAGRRRRRQPRGRGSRSRAAACCSSASSASSTSRRSTAATSSPSTWPAARSSTSTTRPRASRASRCSAPTPSSSAATPPTPAATPRWS